MSIGGMPIASTWHRGFPRRRMSSRLTVAMKQLLVAGLVLVLTVSRAFATAVSPPPIPPPHPADPGTLSIDAFTSGAQATVFRNDGTQSGRSEEHTSELQSQFHLVCRLLLEKKK